MNSQQVVVWIDHREARIFGVDADELEVTTSQAPQHHVHRHPKGATAEHHHPDDARHYFQDVARALEGTQKILIVGPSTAKLQFVRFLHEHARSLEPHVVGLETVDHPTDAQLAAYAKRYFGLPDRQR